MVSVFQLTLAWIEGGDGITNSEFAGLSRAHCDNESNLLLYRYLVANRAISFASR